MKLYFMLVLATMTALAKERQVNLSSLFQGFIQVANIAEMEQVIRDHVESNDPEVASLICYLRFSREFTNMWRKFWRDSEAQRLKKWLKDRDLDLDELKEWLNDLIDVHIIKPCNNDYRQGERSDLLDKLLELMPVEELVKWQLEQTVANQDMLELLQRIKADETCGVANHLYSIPEFQALRCRWQGSGYDIDNFEMLLCKFVEWEKCPFVNCNLLRP